MDGGLLSTLFMQLIPRHRFDHFAEEAGSNTHTRRMLKRKGLPRRSRALRLNEYAQVMLVRR